jgi:hypothetical protein
MGRVLACYTSIDVSRVQLEGAVDEAQALIGRLFGRYV